MREEELLDRENAIYEKWFTEYNRSSRDDVIRLEVLLKAVSRWYGVEFQLKVSLIQLWDSLMNSLTNTSIDG